MEDLLRLVHKNLEHINAVTCYKGTVKVTVSVLKLYDCVKLSSTKDKHMGLLFACCMRIQRSFRRIPRNDSPTIEIENIFHFDEFLAVK